MTCWCEPHYDTVEQAWAGIAFVALGVVLLLYCIFCQADDDDPRHDPNSKH